MFCEIAEISACSKGCSETEHGNAEMARTATGARACAKEKGIKSRGGDADVGSDVLL